MQPSSLRLAYFSPLPPQRSGISDYSRDLLPHLANLAQVMLFADDPALVVDELQQQFEIRPYSDYPSLRDQFDLPIYHLGNSPFHKNIYEMMMRYPGITVLHDYVLHHFLGDQNTWGNAVRYRREVGYAEGAQALFVPPDGDVYERPLNNRAIDLSLGIIAHSRYVADKIAATHPRQPIAHIPHLMIRQKGEARRDILPFPDDGIIFATIGLVTQSKQIDLVLRAFAEVAATTPNVFFLIVGDVLPEVDLENMLAELNLRRRVYLAGYANGLQGFTDWIATADVIINLRYPTTGETSGTALRAMATGKPVVVFNHGWYAEIPAEACVQLPPMDTAALQRAMEHLTRLAARRQAIGEHALQYIETVCNPQQAARAYVDFAHTVLQKYGDGDA